MSLKEAVKFVIPATGELGQYLRLANGHVTAADGVIAAGHPIQETFALCPHAEKLHAALQKVGDKFSVAELDKGRLSVKGGKLRAVVPCVGNETLPDIGPDPQIAPINDALSKAFKTLLPLVREDGETLVEFSFLLNSGSLTATNRNVIFQFWHGINLPKVIVPRKFGKIVAGLESLCGFGFSERSLTFWYENGSWVRTQLCDGSWPNVDALLAIESAPTPLPEDLFEGVKAVADFSDDGAVRLSEGKIRSSYAAKEGEGVAGATFDCEGLASKVCFSAKQLLLLKGVATHIDFDTHNDRAAFFGENLRGLISKRIE
jgi:hypothetical protein